MSSERSKLKDKLDEVFSKYIRIKNADENGICQCVTCGGMFHWKRVDCGHYITRNHMGTRWAEENVGPQCQGCNRFGGGKPDIFAIRIQDKYGPEALQRLNYAKNQITQWQRYELRMMIKMYEDKLKELPIP
jgi:hypothetical protein